MISLSHYDNFMFSTVKIFYRILKEPCVHSNFLSWNGWIFFPKPLKVALDRNGLVQEMMKEQERYGAMEDDRMRFCLFLVDSKICYAAIWDDFPKQMSWIQTWRASLNDVE